MKNILIDAFTRVNLGDDLFIKVLCERHPDTQFYISSYNKYAEPFKAIKNLEVMPIPRYIDGIFSRLNMDYRKSHAIKKQLAEKSDATIIIGGSIFIEPENWEQHVKKNRSLVDASDDLFILGSNFGPYQSKNFYKAYETLFNQVNDVCFRDESSYTLFQHLPTVRTAPDVVFSMDTKNIEYYKLKNHIVISVIDLSWRSSLAKYQELYEESILNISKELIQKGYKVVLMSFCKYQGDEEAISRIMNNYQNENILSYFYEGNMDESLSVIKDSAGVIATRFHSMILGWMFDKPVFPFIYSDKTSNVLKDKSFSGYSLSVSNIKNIDIDQVVGQVLHTQPNDVSSEIKKSEDNFVKLDQFIK